MTDLAGFFALLATTGITPVDGYMVPVSPTTTLRRCQALVENGRRLRTRDDDEAATIHLAREGGEVDFQELSRLVEARRDWRPRRTLRGLTARLEDCTINVHPTAERDVANDDDPVVAVTGVRRTGRPARRWSPFASATLETIEGTTPTLEIIGGQDGLALLERLSASIALLPFQHAAESAALLLTYGGDSRHAIADMGETDGTSYAVGDNDSLAQRIAEALVATFAPMVAETTAQDALAFDRIAIAPPGSAVLRANILLERRTRLCELRDHLAAQDADPHLVRVVAACVDLPPEPLPPDWTGP